MNWLNINVSTLDSESYLCATHCERSTWLNLLRYCIGQENEGTIKGAKAFGNRHWRQLVRVSLQDVQRPSKLWDWDGDDLQVNFYPGPQEAAVKAKRNAALVTHAKCRSRRDAQQGGKGKELNETENEGNDQLTPLSSFPISGVLPPTLEECVEWGRSVGIEDQWIRIKHTNTSCTNGWVRNGKPIMWRELWKSWHETDSSTAHRVNPTGGATLRNLPPQNPNPINLSSIQL